jgi:hypothetical protein
MENLALIEKIRRLPPEKLQEIQEFVDLLDQQSTREHPDSLAARGISCEEAAEQRAALMTFADDWELPEMDVYDEL